VYLCSGKVVHKMNASSLCCQQNQGADSLTRAKASTSVTPAACLLICYVAGKLCTHLNTPALNEGRLTSKTPPL